MLHTFSINIKPQTWGNCQIFYLIFPCFASIFRGCYVIDNVMLCQLPRKINHKVLQSTSTDVMSMVHLSFNNEDETLLFFQYLNSQHDNVLNRNQFLEHLVNKLIKTYLDKVKHSTTPCTPTGGTCTLYLKLPYHVVSNFA